MYRTGYNFTVQVYRTSYDSTVQVYITGYNIAVQVYRTGYNSTVQVYLGGPQHRHQQDGAACTELLTSGKISLFSLNSWYQDTDLILFSVRGHGLCVEDGEGRGKDAEDHEDRPPEPQQQPRAWHPHF